MNDLATKYVDSSKKVRAVKKKKKKLLQQLSVN